MNLIQQLEQEEIARVWARPFPNLPGRHRCRSGEGHEGNPRASAGLRRRRHCQAQSWLNSNFIVRKISSGEALSVLSRLTLRWLLPSN